MSLKNLKIDEQTHARLEARAERMGMGMARLAEHLITIGLRMSDVDIIKAVADESGNVPEKEKKR